MSPSEVIVWDLDEVLSTPPPSAGLASLPMRDSLICATEPGVAELAPVKGMAGHTEPEPAASPSRGN